MVSQLGLNRDMQDLSENGDLWAPKKAVGSFIGAPGKFKQLPLT